MHIYKFRMLSGLNEEFVRDIEIRATQTFMDFHTIISECVNLNVNDLSSFHICDQKWNKNTEITLIDMLEGESDDEKDKMVEETYTMRETQIRNFINEPHQRLLYEYDFLNMKTLFIELLSVYKQKDDDPYPRCTLSRGEAKEEVLHADMIGDDEDLQQHQMLEDFEELLDSMEEFNENEN